MFFRQKLILKAYLPFRCVNCKNLRHFHLSYSAHIRGFRRENYRPVYEIPEKNCGNAVDAQESFNRNNNFYGIESDEGVIIVDESKSVYVSKLDSSKEKTNKREICHSTSFGIVRRDSENKLKYHGEYESSILNHQSMHSVATNISRSVKNASTFKSKKQLIQKNKVECSPADPRELLHISNQNKNSLASDCVYHEASVYQTASEHLNIYESKCQSGLQCDFSDTAQNQESNLSFIDQLYFSDSTDKLANSKIKSPLSSEVLKEFSKTKECYFEKNDVSNYLENEAYVTNENFNILLDSNKNKKIEAVKYHPSPSENTSPNSEIKESPIINVSFHNADKSKNSVNSTQTNITPDNGGVKNFSGTLFFNKMAPKSNNVCSLNNPSSVNEKIADKNSDHFYESILKSSKEVNIDISSVFRDRKKLNSSSNSESIGSYLEPGDFSQSVLNKIKSTNYDRSDNRKTSTQLNSIKVGTAYDFVSKLREEKDNKHHIIRKGMTQPKLDSKGFRILSNQVPDLSSCTRDEILQDLITSVLYADDDLIVLNKPYNLVIHDSKTVKEPCLSKFLDDMAEELDKKNLNPKLFTVHRIDKETTGCLLLARNELAAHNLKSLFAQRKVLKTYWIVTTRIPDPLEGIIDIPITEGNVEKKSRMVLKPNIPKDMSYRNHCKGGLRAVTRYKVISMSGNAALIEVKPETGIKHQIRVHFGLGLSCPILGDHKYSHLSKLAPQKLTGDLLQRLHVRQSKVRHIPMHIHSRSILIPEYHQDGRNLFVMAPLPEHMSKNLKSLKFKK